MQFLHEQLAQRTIASVHQVHHVHQVHQVDQIRQSCSLIGKIVGLKDWQKLQFTEAQGAQQVITLYQCVTIPKMLDDTDTDTFFPIPNIFDTDTGTFFGTKLF